MKKRGVLLVSTVLYSIFFFSSIVSAQESSSTIQLKEDVSSTSNSPFHLTMSLTSASTMYKEDARSREGYTELLINPSAELSKDLSLGLKGTITHEETQARNTAVSNTALTLKRKGPQLGIFESSGSLTGTAPTNEDDRKVNRFQGAGTLGGSLTTHWKNVDVTYGLAATRNFHEFTVNADGSPNVQYSLSQILGLEVELTHLWSLSFGGLFKRGWTYHDFQRDSFGLEAGVNLNVRKNLQVSAGISNEGNALKANGSESNINIYDENTSVIRASVTFIN